MGLFAEAIAAYAQPLLNDTDGSLEEMQRAMTFSQLCWNISVAPHDQRGKVLDDLRSGLGMAVAEFEEFRQSVIEPMIRRHEEMFPAMHAGRRLDAMGADLGLHAHFLANADLDSDPDFLSDADLSFPMGLLSDADLPSHAELASHGRPSGAVSKEPYPGTEPYAPCPCNSGRKYKFCCRAKRR
jgi:hypothetical protein